MQFISTRNNNKAISFKEVTLRGLADDGGLYIPNQWPSINIEAFKDNMDFKELAFLIIKSFVGDSLEDKKLKSLVYNSYKSFSSKEITPIRKLDNNNYLLELYHGPTLAFKDIALQFLGNLFDEYLEGAKRRLTIIGATSGDTGSAAIEALKHNNNTDIFILHPYKRVSEFQRRQMTTVLSKNIHNLAVKGTFDDCQNIIKKLFRDKELNNKLNLGSINSINWTRIMAQITYYVYAYNKVKKISKSNKICFSIPTGNFGDAYAGYIAKMKLNVPIDKLIVATNNNNILDRFFKTGLYKKEEVYKTISPSMDIQIASNFERLLYDIYKFDKNKVNELMSEFKKTSIIKANIEDLKETRKQFKSFTINEELTNTCIRRAYNKYNIVIDPHTAVGLEAANQYIKENKDAVVVTLATAHPSKFSESVEKNLGFNPKLPNHYNDIFNLKEKYQVFNNSYQDIYNYIINNS